MAGWIMKKTVRILGMLFLLLAMSGCGKILEDGKGSGFSNIGAVTAVEDTLYLVQEHQLYVWEPGEEKARSYCQVPGCQHQDDGNCAAFLRREFGNTLCSDGKYLYVAQEDDSHKLCWYRYEIGQGTGQGEAAAEIAELPEVMDCSMESVYHDGYVFFILGVSDGSGEWNYALCRQRLSEKPGKAKEIYRAEPGTFLENISLCGDRIYLSQWNPEGGELISLDENGKDRSTVLEDTFITSYVLEKEKIWYSCGEPGIFTMDLKSGQKDSFAEELGSQLLLSWDGEFLYADNFNAARPEAGDSVEPGQLLFGDRKISVFGEDQKAAGEISMAGMGGCCWFGDQEILLAEKEGLIQYAEKNQMGQSQEPENVWKGVTD